MIHKITPLKYLALIVILKFQYYIQTNFKMKY